MVSDVNEMLHEPLRPSPKVLETLHRVGWSDTGVDASHWIARLRQDGHDVPPVAEAILRTFGGLRLRRRSLGGPSYDDIDVNPELWYDERERVARTEAALSMSACPLGETSGAAMLGVLKDGRIISEYKGYVDLLGNDWRQALDHLVLGRGSTTPLARDFQRVD